jgi:hypothetical protein
MVGSSKVQFFAHFIPLPPKMQPFYSKKAALWAASKEGTCLQVPSFNRFNL